MMRTRSLTAGLTTFLAVAVVTTAGCSSGPKRQQLDVARSSPNDPAQVLPAMVGNWRDKVWKPGKSELQWGDSRASITTSKTGYRATIQIKPPGAVKPILFAGPLEPLTAHDAIGLCGWTGPRNSAGKQIVAFVPLDKRPGGPTTYGAVLELGMSGDPQITVYALGGGTTVQSVALLRQ